MRTVVAGLLALEALLTATWVAGRLAVAAAYPWSVLAMIAVRAVVGAFQCAAAWTLATRSPAGRSFAQAAFAASALLLVCEIGLQLSPSSIFPAYRWPWVGVYAAYAAAAIALVRRRDAAPSEPEPG
jgi:hypothetical protein